MDYLTRKINEFPIEKNGWAETVREILCYCQHHHREIDWESLETTLQRFPDNMREQVYFHLPSFVEEDRKENPYKYEKIYLVFKYWKIHRASFGGKIFGNPYLSNLTHIWVYYKDSDDDYISLYPLFENKNLASLEHIKIQSLPLIDRERTLIKENIINFPSLKKIIFINCGDKNFFDELRNINPNIEIADRALGDRKGFY